MPVPPIDVQITVGDLRATFEGIYPLGLVRDLTSYFVQGYKYSEAYKRKRWDGKKHLFDIPSHSLPSGLVDHVVRGFKAANPQARIERLNQQNCRKFQEADKNWDQLGGIAFAEGKYDYQREAALAMISSKRGILKVATNGGKTSIICAVIKYFHIPTLFLVRGLELLDQSRKRIAEHLEIPLNQVGMVGDGEMYIAPWVTVATPNTLNARIGRPEIIEAMNNWKLFIADECHNASADVTFDVLAKLKAPFRFGASATPLDRSDGADLRLVAQTGEILYDVPSKMLVERGISVQPYLDLVKIQGPKLPKKLPWAEVHQLGVVENQELNERVLEKVKEYSGLGNSIWVLVKHLEHGEYLAHQIKERKLCSASWINGKESSDTRKKALQQFKNGKVKCLIATSILDQGVDIPNIDVIIYADAGKSKITTLQRAGRGVRRGEGKERVIIVDFIHFGHHWLSQHSLRRVEIYRQEDCFKNIGEIAIALEQERAARVHADEDVQIRNSPIPATTSTQSG